MITGFAPRAAAGLAILAGLAVYAYGLYHAPALTTDGRQRQAWLEATVRAGAADPTQEADLAEAYWTRYPDVAADALYGRSGTLKVLGAREHYRQHGRREGRLWGPDPQSTSP